MTRESGVVAVPTSYFFKMAKLDYAKWERALPREFFQNSVDAGATLIEIDADEEKRTITVTDNGCGMEYDTIKEKLLVLGGSKKDQGSVGAFGKAKEILFFSWKEYQIRTQNWLVTGEGASYTIEKVKEWYEGTTCTIKVWESENFTDLKNEFEYVAGCFQVDCRINYLGGKVDCLLRRGELIRSMDWADLYLDRSMNSYRVSVRISGQWMFEEWFSYANDVGKIVLEIHGDSLDALTSNRDALKGEYAKKFRDLLAEFITETKSAMEPEKVIVREKFTGTGKVVVSQEKMEEQMAAFLKELPVMLDEGDRADAIIDMLPAENIGTVDMDRVVETVQRGGSLFKHKDRFKFIGFQPDFHLLYDEKQKDKWRVDKFMQGDNAGRLANAWTEVLKQVLLDIEEYITFNVGFDFSLTTAASYEKLEGEHYFYLNPQLLLSDCQGSPKWYRSSKALLREDLILKAIHEIGHATISMHNENFVMHTEWIRARTWRSLSIYPKIIKECFLTH